MQLPEIGLEWRERIRIRLETALREDPNADLDGLLEGLLGDAIEAARKDGAARLLETWKRTEARARRRNRRDRVGFEARLEDRWGAGFEQFSLLVLAAMNAPGTCLS
jgi:hypothetical protein